MSTTTWSLPTWMTLPLTMSPSLMSSLLRDSPRTERRSSRGRGRRCCRCRCSSCSSKPCVVLSLPGPVRDRGLSEALFSSGRSEERSRVLSGVWVGVSVRSLRAPRPFGWRRMRKLASVLGNVNRGGHGFVTAPALCCAACVPGLPARACWPPRSSGSASCDGCPGARRGATAMCGACVETAACVRPLECTNGVSETAPPSCHVNIGL